MTKREKLQLMGKIVTVTHVYERSLQLSGEKLKAIWIKEDLPKPRSGWVCGFRYVFDGERVAGCGSTDYYGDYEYEQGYFAVENTIPCLMVSFWTNTNPVRVPMDCFTIGGTPEPPTVYSMDAYFSWRGGATNYKDDLREIMKYVPRDEKGRWL